MPSAAAKEKYREKANVVDEVVNLLGLCNVLVAERVLDEASERWKLKNRSFYHQILRRCAAVGDCVSAIWIVEYMERRGFSPTLVTYNFLLHVCARSGDLAAAQRHWRTLLYHGLKPDITTYNTMLNACSQAFAADQAEQLMHELLREDIEPTCITYGTLIDSFAKVDRIAEAEDWVGRMRQRGIPPDRVVFNSLIKAYGNINDCDQAEKWFAAMLADGIQGDDKTFSSLIRAYTNSGQLARSETTLCRLQERFSKLDVDSFAVMICSWARAGSLDRCENWMLKILEYGVTPSPSSYDVLLRLAALHNDYDTCFAWLRQATKNETPLFRSTFANLIELSTTTGNSSAVIKALQHEMLSATYEPETGPVPMIDINGSASRQKAEEITKASRSPQQYVQDPLSSCSTAVSELFSANGNQLQRGPVSAPASSPGPRCRTHTDSAQFWTAPASSSEYSASRSSANGNQLQRGPVSAPASCSGPRCRTHTDSAQFWTAPASSSEYSASRSSLLIDQEGCALRRKAEEKLEMLKQVETLNAMLQTGGWQEIGKACRSPQQYVHDPLSSCSTAASELFSANGSSVGQKRQRAFAQQAPFSAPAGCGYPVSPTYSASRQSRVAAYADMHFMPFDRTGDIYGLTQVQRASDVGGQLWEDECDDFKAVFPTMGTPHSFTGRSAAPGRLSPQLVRLSL